MTYKEFLETKIELATESGFIVDLEKVNKVLKPHQRDAVVWALKGGRRALFESFGLGKTVQEIEFCHLASEHSGGRALIVLPLGVKQEFTHDAVEVLGYEKPEYCRTMEEVEQSTSQIVLTNYERVRDGDIRPDYFAATSLDEASVLRSFGSKTYQTFLDKFKNVPYKLVATATPSPNKYKELIHYAGYLEVMDTGQALTRFFQRDSTKANNLTLYPNMEDEFWMWVSSWALFITKPSDLNPVYSDEGYDLPPLDVRWHELPVHYGDTADKDGQIQLFQEAAEGLKEAATVKRDSIDRRVEEMKRIVEESPEDHFLLWHDLENERHAIKKALPDVVDIYGSMDYDLREQRVIDFSNGRTKLFATKKSLSGSGCNFQRHCHREIFLGIDYEFNDFIQAVHRCYRFLQKEPVVIDIIYMENERQIKEALLEKWKNHNHMVAKMIEIVKKYGLNSENKAQRLERKMGVEGSREERTVRGNHYEAVYGDCVEETRAMETNSIDLIHTSIPFGNHYEYSANYNDFGHNQNTDRFFEQMDFLTPELLRVLKPGRVAAIHVKDRVLFGNVTGTGFPTMEPFHAECIRHYTKHGFLYFGMITVVTDVVRENNQTYRLGWSDCCKDGTKMGVGCPEYILLFRKQQTDHSKGFADERVSKSKEEYTRAQWQIDAHGYWRSSGDRLVSKEELKEFPVDSLQQVYREYSRGSVYNYGDHVKLAEDLDKDGKLPATFMVVAPGSWNQLEVWDDINRMRTLNTTQSRKRAQMHVCPLQLDIVERIINRYSNEGDTVYDPFGGLMTVPMTAVKMHRNGKGCELNPDYFRDGVGYLQAAENEVDEPTLFDFMGMQS
jgi:DNA modification methylase|nr:MAG TPA: Helicase of the snf2 rad54 family [Caudoviricetes sp.]